VHKPGFLLLSIKRLETFRHGIRLPIPVRIQRFPYEKLMTTDVSCATVVHPITKYADSGRTLVRILVVDDHDGMRAAVISELQSRQDFEICGEASNGEEAVQKAHLLLPDVIILDVMMPVKDGLTAAMEIRRGLPRTPILMISAQTDEDVVRESKLVGAQGFLLKLGIPHALLRAVDALLEGQTFF
jgi:CheY-like chemotaxis protein